MYKKWCYGPVLFAVQWMRTIPTYMKQQVVRADVKVFDSDAHVRHAVNSLVTCFAYMVVILKLSLCSHFDAKLNLD